MVHWTQWNAICTREGLRRNLTSQEVMRHPMSDQGRDEIGFSHHSVDRVIEAETIVHTMVEQAHAYAVKTWKSTKHTAEERMPKVVFDWRPMRKSSWGGWKSTRTPMGRISLAMCNYVPEHNLEQNKFLEYDSITNDPDIGTYFGTWQDCVAILSLHEYAHVVANSERQKGHGERWQEIYRALRRELLPHTTSVGEAPAKKAAKPKTKAPRKRTTRARKSKVGLSGEPMALGV